MPLHRKNLPYRFPLMALAAISAAGTTFGASAIDWGRDAHREDSETCRRIGASHGDRYTDCMLQQQRRRDDALLDASRQQRNNAEAARDNVETVRRMRCNREAERARERGERPQRCT
jgi:hypothetical protein